MKRFILIIGTVVFFLMSIISCSPQKFTNQDKEIISFGLDFREYSEKGFLFMPNEYFGEYEVKGMITAELHPEIKYNEGRQVEIPGQLVTYIVVGGSDVSQVITLTDTDELLNYIYNLATEWGGDAFSHFDMSIETGRTDDNPNSGYSYTSISGLVIKRK